MNCPKCRGALTAETAGRVTIDRCAGCGGIWLDALEAEKLHAATSADAIDSGPAPNATHQPPATDPAEAMACPRCGVRMIVLLVEGTPSFLFEHCGACNGVFLDAGELRAMRGATLDQWLRATIPGVYRLKLRPR